MAPYEAVLSLAVVLVFSVGTDALCLTNEFQCVNGSECISADLFCDGKPNCGDASDEIRFNKSAHTSEEGFKCRSHGFRGYICLIPAQQQDKKTALCRPGDSCGEGEFECADGSRCISARSFCNRIPSCSDGSDEILYDQETHRPEDGIACRSRRDKSNVCLLPAGQAERKKSICGSDTMCEDNEFECVDGSRCVSSDSFCVGWPLCRDASDERRFNKSSHTLKDGVTCRDRQGKGYICLLPSKQQHKKTALCGTDSPCTDKEFECLDGSGCLATAAFCNGYPGCGDGSDEILFDNATHTTDMGFPCRNMFQRNDRVCLFPEAQAQKAMSICRPRASCNSDQFECTDGESCRPLFDFCNGKQGCRDNSDEEKFEPKASDRGVKCLGYKEHCLLPNKYVCDGIDHCNDKADECYCGQNRSYINPAKSCFRCLDNLTTITTQQLCDGIFDCKDLSDECLCSDKPLIHIANICNQVKWADQPYIGDFTCSDNSSSANLTVENICDKNFDCVGTSEDENLCRKASPDCTVDPNDDVSVKCDHKCTMERGKLAKRCDGRFTCAQPWEEECNECENPPPACEYIVRYRGLVCPDTTAVAGYQICDGVSDCKDGRDEELCSHRFYCGNSTTVSIPIEKKCDLIKDCEDSSDEIDCLDSTTRNCKITRGRKVPNGTTCELTHFYCKDGGSTVYIDRREKVCDGNDDCDSGIDECQNCTAGTFSNDDFLISPKPMVPFLWIISILALFGNAAVICWAIFTFAKNRRTLNKNEKMLRILVANLSVANLLVGIYTTAVSILNIVLSSGRYCHRDQYWRSTVGCSVLGTVVMLGSEASVLVMVIITVVRINAVNRVMDPFLIRKVCLYLAMAWVVALLIAVIPHFPVSENYFVRTVRYKDNLLGSKMDLEDVSNYSVRMIAMLKSDVNSSFVVNNGGIGSWELFEALTKILNPSYVVQRRFGYYSTHGLCLPRLFPNPSRDRSWGFSLATILTNFLAFVFIFLGNVFVYKKATKATVSEESAAKRGAELLQGKFTRILFTDFCCWIPICIMAFLQLTGIDIPKNVYVPVGTVLIPINSAINPFLFTNSPEWLWKKLSPARERVRARLAPAWERMRMCRKGKSEVEVVELN